MPDPWFSNEVARLFALVSLLAVLGGLQIFAQRGVYRSLVMATGLASVAVGLALLAAGVVALAVGQPRFVSGPLLLSGFVLSVTCAAGVMELHRLYAQAQLPQGGAQT